MNSGLHVCNDKCHASRWHGPLYDLASGLSYAAQLYMQYGWAQTLHARAETCWPNNRWDARAELRTGIPAGAAWVKLPCGEHALIYNPQYGTRGGYWWVEAVHGSCGTAQFLDDAVKNCDNAVRGRANVAF